jgi:hypothetical protein
MLYHHHDMGGVQKMHAAKTTIMVILFWIGTTLSALAEDCASKLAGDPPVKDIIDCLKKQEAELSEFRKAREDAVPEGAVMAFDRSDLDEDHCPPGWAPFLEARARVLVGAGDPKKAPGKMAFDETARPLKGYVLRQHGGEQVHQLTAAEIPEYAPRILNAQGNPVDLRETDVVPCVDNGCNQKGALTEGFRPGQHTNTPLHLESLGKDPPNSGNNMPPFLSIYYCRKLSK